MPFRFALASILRLRQSIERQRTLQLQEANLKVTRAQQEVVQIDRFLANSDQSDLAMLGGGRTAAELQFVAALRKNLMAFREELQSEVRKLELLRQKALADYHQAYRDREILESLRARQRQTYQQEQTRRQQQELDAAHLLQRWHRRT